jgi:hypothetical protein
MNLDLHSSFMSNKILTPLYPADYPLNGDNADIWYIIVSALDLTNIIRHFRRQRYRGRLIIVFTGSPR